MGSSSSTKAPESVTSVVTTGLGDRTAKGVGVGSTEGAVRANVPGVRCERISGSRSCHTHAFTAGRRVTDFFIRGGKVTRVHRRLRDRLSAGASTSFSDLTKITVNKQVK